MKTFLLILLAIVVWLVPLAAAYLFKDSIILWAWFLSLYVTDQILTEIKR